MEITNVATTAGGTSQPAKGQWKIVSPGAVSPLQFYQQVLYLHFDTGGIADQVALDSSATVLQGSFQSYDFNALGSEIQPPASLLSGTQSGVVLVTLDAPRQVVQVGLSQAPKTSYSIELHRVDGDNVVDKLTASAAGNGTTPVDFTSNDFTDVHFAMQFNKEVQPGLDKRNISTIEVRGYPTNPRIGIPAPPTFPAPPPSDHPNQLSSVVFFWPASGEIRKAPASQGIVDGDKPAGKDLADALERYLNAALADDWKRYQDGLAQHPPVSIPPPPGYDVALVIASDAPCNFKMTGFNIVYHRVLQSFPSREEKQSLRFAGKQASAQTVSVNLPGNATVTKATLKTVESFRRERPASIGDNENPPLDATLLEKNGAYLGSNRWVAQGITPTQAISASGIALGLMALTAKTEVLVELQEDWQGKPSGKKLTSGTVALANAGPAHWVRLVFPQSIILSSQPYWILVKAASGSAIWLIDTGTTPIQVLEKADQTSNWTELSILKGLEALYQLFSDSDAVQEQQPVVLSIGNTPVTPLSNNGSTKEAPTMYDLTAPLNTYLRNQGSTSNVSVPLTFTAVVPGIITVYPPRIEYDI